MAPLRGNVIITIREEDRSVVSAKLRDIAKEYRVGLASMPDMAEDVRKAWDHNAKLFESLSNWILSGVKHEAR